MFEVYLLLGGNIGDTLRIFQESQTCISKEIGTIIRQSAMYRSPAWGFESSQDFLNQVLCVKTHDTPDELLRHCMSIETELGRQRNENVPGYASRIIDIDILLYEQMNIFTESLSVPHPRMHLRRFALIPLAEIAPALMHPQQGISIAKLLDACIDTSEVLKIH